MPTYEVRSLDVWGHCGSECESDCPCMRDGEHDDNRCECHYDVNDSFRCGTVDVPTDASDAALLAILDEQGFIHAALCEVDDYSDGTILDIVSKETARPLLQLCEVES